MAAAVRAPRAELRALRAVPVPLARDAHGTEHQHLAEPAPTDVPCVTASMGNEGLRRPRPACLKVERVADWAALGELHRSRTADLAATYPHRPPVVAADLPQHLLNQPTLRLRHTQVPWIVHLDHSLVTPPALGCVDAGVDGTLPE